jgi:hypothetical protein
MSAPEACLVACVAGDIWLEHAIARCESDLRPLPPQVASAPAGFVATRTKPRVVGQRIDPCLARQISKASPFLPLLVAPGGLDTVKLLQRRMLLDRYYETSTLDAQPPSSSPPVCPATKACAHHSAAVPEPDAVVGRASALGVMGPEGVLALQVNGWEPLIENVTEAEQREFVHKFTQIDVADEDARIRLLRKFSGRLGKVNCMCVCVCVCVCVSCCLHTHTSFLCCTTAHTHPYTFTHTCVCCLVCTVTGGAGRVGDVFAQHHGGNSLA